MLAKGPPMRRGARCFAPSSHCPGENKQSYLHVLRIPQPLEDGLWGRKLSNGQLRVWADTCNRAGAARGRRRIAQLGERPDKYNGEVAGSTPAPPTSTHVVVVPSPKVQLQVAECVGNHRWQV